MPRTTSITKEQLIKLISAYKKQAGTCTPHTRSKGKKLTKAQIESKWLKNPTIKKKVEEVKKKRTTKAKTQKQATITSFFVRK